MLKNCISQFRSGKMASALEQLKKMTVVVADTGDFESKYFIYKS